jgi:type II restriction/modification system DNA methylase subunit YeeA
VLDLTGDDLAVLEAVGRLDWGSIEPAILGTLFERSLEPDKRSQLGAHYTGLDDIRRVVEPVLMAPLRRRWAVVRAEAEALIGRREAATTPAVRSRHQQALRSALLGFSDELAAVRVGDFACGSGNFLYVALKELLDLEKEVSLFGALNGLPAFFPQVGPHQLHGIETNVYAHQLASVVVWIGYLQWLDAAGFGVPSDPILKPLTTIQHRDAILTDDEQGRPVEPEWPTVDVIIGNPPFLGGNKIRQELGDAYVDRLFRLYDGRVPAFADYVCYWFEKARAHVAAGKARRVGLLATQGIRGGANRRVLERIKQTGDIFWAQSDRDWILDGATVHVSMVGFDDGTEQARELDDQTVATINADLTAATDLTQAKRLPENNGICFMGPSPKAPFDIDAATAQGLLTGFNINGRPNSDVVRPVASGIDLTNRPRGKWTIDFGLMPLEQAVQYERPFEYVKKTVYPVRMDGRRAKYAGNWWQYARPRYEMRDALQGRNRYIATPAVSKHRVFVWMKPEVLCNQQTLVFARDDDYFFGVLHSRPHELWARGTGTQLREAESGFRYTPTTTFETFPLPWPPGQEPAGDARAEAIAAAARTLVAQRDAWLNPPGASAADLKQRTLTNLYNQRPTWLALAHQALDAAVLAAYGWPADLGDDDLLARLLVLNQERAAQSSPPGAT